MAASLEVYKNKITLIKFGNNHKPEPPEFRLSGPHGVSLVSVGAKLSAGLTHSKAKLDYLKIFNTFPHKNTLKSVCYIASASYVKHQIWDLWSVIQFFF